MGGETNKDSNLITEYKYDQSELNNSIDHIQTNKYLLNDVWKSKDGIKWENIIQKTYFTPRVDHETVYFQNNI